MCYNCDKLSYIVHHCWNKRTINASITRSKDNFAFVANDEASESLVTRWIIDSRPCNT